ncbi:MAG: glycosyltransferase [Deferrisomatales bacterium]
MSARRLRVALLSLHSNPLGALGTRDTGGMSVYVRELARELGCRGHVVDVYTGVRPPGLARVAPLAGGARLVHLDGGVGAGVRDGLYPRLPRYFEALESFRAARGAAYDLVYSHYWLSGKLGTWASALWGAPHVTMFHTLGAVKNALACGEDEPQVRLAEEAALARRCDLLVAPTRSERDHLVRLYGAAPEKVAVIPCAVDRDRFRTAPKARARRRLGLGAEETVLLYVGRFAPVKGLDLLLSALPLLRECGPVRLLVVGGDGAEGRPPPELRSLAQRCGRAASVRFVGRVPQEALAPYYSAADALVVPSRYESFGLVTLEALACGTPVVATPVGAAADVIRPGVNGALAAAATAEALAAALQSALERFRSFPPEPHRVRAAVAGYTWPRVVSALLDRCGGLLEPVRPCGQPCVSGCLA